MSKTAPTINAPPHAAAEVPSRDGWHGGNSAVQQKLLVLRGDRQPAATLACYHLPTVIHPHTIPVLG